MYIHILYKHTYIHIHSMYDIFKPLGMISGVISHTKIRKNVINMFANICFSRSALTFIPPPSFRFISDETLKGPTVFGSNLK